MSEIDFAMASIVICRSVTATRHKMGPELRVCRIMEGGGSLCYMRYVAEVPLFSHLNVVDFSKAAAKVSGSRG
jgi:hypothetical protein